MNKKIGVICLIIILFSFVIATLITINNGKYINNIDAWISFIGSITGGLLTLIGVWWTIKKQKQDFINQQKKLDLQRRNDLSNQYRPFLFSKEYTSENINLKTIPKSNIVQAFHVISIGKEKPNIKFVSNIKIKNYGEGECYINCIEDPIITSFPKSINFLDIPADKNDEILLIKKDYCNIIPRQEEFHIHIEIQYNNKEVLSIDSIEVIYHFIYHDQFKINTYNAPIKIIINVIHEKEKRKIHLQIKSISIDNDLLKEKDNIPLISEELKLKENEITRMRDKKFN